MKQTTHFYSLKRTLAPIGVGFFATVLTLFAPANSRALDLYNWTGFYVGGNVGGEFTTYGFDRGHIITDDVDIAQQFYNSIQVGTPGDETGIASFLRDEDHHKHNGTVIGGGQLGFNYQIGHFVFGVEGDADRTAASSTQHFVGFDEDVLFIGGGQVNNQIAGDTTFTSTRRAETNWTGSVRGKFGIAEGPFLFYVTGGVAFADIEVWSIDTASTDFFINRVAMAGTITPQQGAVSQFLGTVASTNVSHSDDVEVGWTGGVGLGWAMSDLISLALEYRHSEYGDQSYHFSSHGGPIFPAPVTVGTDSDQLTLRFNVMLSHFFGH